MITADRYDINNPWPYMPWGLLVSLFLWGAMIVQLPLHERQLQTITAELIELHPPEKHFAAPAQPKQKPLLKTTPPQLRAAAQKEVADKPVAQTPGEAAVQPPITAVALPETNMNSGNKGVSYNAPAKVKSPVSSAHGSGNSITPPQFGAAYLNNPKPQYPSFARRMGIQGTVMLKVLVSREGFTLKVQIAQSSGPMFWTMLPPML